MGVMVERMNSDLANTLGNLVNRTISMSNKYFDGIVEDKGARMNLTISSKLLSQERERKYRRRWMCPCSGCDDRDLQCI